MSNIIQLPIIAGVEITTDAEGRFNLNLLHKASGENSNKAPAQWMRTKQAQEFIAEVEKQTMQICTVSAEGRNGGTFAHELIAVEYAGWISASFRIKVNQTFIDYRTGNLKPAIPQSLPEALRLAAEAMEERDKLKPKAEALDRIATSDGSLCITNAAKDLQIRPKDLFAWLSGNKWIYRRPGGNGWIAYQDKLQTGYLEHKITVITRTDGSEKTTEQVRITPKGLAKLAKVMSERDAA